MRLIQIIVLSVFACAASVASADVAELYGRASAVWDARVSPDGSKVALGCAPTGRQAVCIFSLTENAEPQVFYAGDEARVESFYWASDEYLVGVVAITENVRSARGMKQYDVRRAISYHVGTEDTAILMRDQGAWSDLTGLVSVCDSKPDTMVMQIGYRPTERNEIGTRLSDSLVGVRTALYDVDLASGKSRDRPVRDASVVKTILDTACDPVVNVIYNDERQAFRIERADTRATLLEKVGVQIWPMSALGLNNSRDGLIVRADYEDLVGLYEIGLEDGSISPITYEGVELGKMGIIRNHFSDAVIGFTGTDDLQRHFYIDENLRALQSRISNALGGANVRVSSFTRNYDLYTLEAEQPGRPTEFFLYEADPENLSPLGSAAPQFAERLLPTIEPASFSARDGLTIPAYVVLPPGKTLSDGPFPTVVMPHGGPEARDTARFDWWSQGLAEAGYAVIKPNFRGSSGYGREFRDAGFGEFGGKMIADIVDAISWAEAEGIAAPDGVCVAGASYGGYAALMSALRAPGRAACIIAVAPVTNIYEHMARFERDTATYRYWSRYVGGDVFASEDVKRDITPAQRVGDFSAPVLLMHGKDDLVVTIAQARRFKDEWGSRPGLTYIELEGQDHFLRTTQARYEVLRASLAHLAANHPAR